jgi:glycolate oxidase
MTSKAITENREWNTKIVSTEQGEVAQEILNEFKNLWMSPNSQYYEEFIEDYKEQYLQNQIIKKQQRQAAKEQIVDFESYKLKPNKMQLAFINNLMEMRSEGIEKALLLSSTGTGKTYASAFAVRELGYQKVLFLVHRNQIAEQALKSYQKVFGPSVTMGLVTGKSHDYGADFIFATVQTLSKTENLERFARDHFECCIYDEAHHTSADSYKKVMDYFTPQLLNKEEVSEIMKYAYEQNIPVVCRGAGTGLAGGATCKYGGIMLSVMRMNKIFPVDHKNQTITAQPGALLIDIQAAAKEEGLFYPPDPGEKTASIGGNVITNAGGMKAVRYGLTRDFVRCIEAVMPDGSIMNFSSNVVKNTTGFDVKDLVIGSEGILCILTEVTLKLLPAPTCSSTLVMPFRSLEECADMVPKVLDLPFVPTAIEFLERELIDIVERSLHKLFPVKHGEAVLIVMYDASSKEELDRAVEAAAEAALENGALDCNIAGTPERAASVWEVRGAILEGMKADSVAQEECDVVVPRSEIAEYVKQAKKIASAHGIRVEPCGHCGDGNIHTEMLRGPEMSDEEWKKATHESLTELYALSKKLGGQLSGEHGIGNGRLDFLEEFAGPRMIELYKSIKRAFDDKLILNPGKMIKIDEN